VPANSVLLFEDIDCMKSSQSRVDSEVKDTKQNSSPQNGVTLSGLLNVLDGFYAPTGVLFVMTTNHVEKLDQALLRPGRIDYRLYLGKASERQKVELYRRFFPHASETEAREFVEASRSAETMAEFQGLLLGLVQGEARIDLAELGSKVSA
jgi:mitochondrial chaperone BCS1